MKTIFDNIKGRKWDWFGLKKSNPFFQFNLIDAVEENCSQIQIFFTDEDYNLFSLADLLANKSWCKAVWGDSIDCVCTGYSHDCKCNPQWINCSQYAFAGLQISGEESCLKYIKETMNA